MHREAIIGTELNDSPEPPAVGWARKLGYLFAFGLAIQSIWVSYFGAFEPTLHRSVALWVCTAVVLLVPHGGLGVSRGSRLTRWAVTALDLVMLVVMGAAVYRFLAGADDMENLVASFSTFDQWVALGAMLTLIELSRRLFGVSLALVALFSLLYALYGQYLPGLLRHTGFSLEQVVEVVWFGFQGVFGLPTAIVLSLIMIFVVFGSVLQSTGAGDSLIKIAFALAGGSRGGPAHAAITASAIFGTMSGSVAANVVGTGAFTIPMIKKRGFSGTFAGAVEAAASTGGQIMPPVMGAAAFLMAELTGVSYAQLCIAALLPALFYYASLFVTVAMQARRLGIEPVPAAERERLSWSDLTNAMMFLVPIAVIIIVLIMGRSPAMAGFWATLSAMVMGFINPAVRRNPAALVNALTQGGVSSARLMMAVGAIGILLAVLDLTGISLRFATSINVISDANLFIALLVTAGACLLLGMGMPTFPAYLIIVLVLGPGIKHLGIPDVAVHMFVFYFGVLSAVTPPVAIAAFAAAPISGASPMATATMAVGLSLSGFLIPFVFVYDQSLLLILGFEWGELLWVILRLSLAIYLVSTAIAGFENARLALWSRTLRLLAVVLVLNVMLAYQLAGIVLAVTLILAARRADTRPMAA